MKYLKLYIIIIFTVVVLVCGCVNLEEYIPIEEYNFKISELEEANSEIDSNAIEILELKEEVNTLENDLTLGKEETEKYKDLIANLNEYLKNIYYGYASNSEWISDGFTAFSIEYGEQYYILTAGHCVENEYGKFSNFKFKANFSNEWIFPELLTYNNADDYAVLYSNKINSGLKISKDTIYDIYNLGLDLYVLGNEDTGVNILKKSGVRIEGESGSPIISQNGEVVGIVVDDLLGTPIETVIKAIDKIR